MAQGTEKETSHRGLLAPLWWLFNLSLLSPARGLASFGPGGGAPGWDPLTAAHTAPESQRRESLCEPCMGASDFRGSGGDFFRVSLLLFPRSSINSRPCCSPVPVLSGKSASEQQPRDVLLFFKFSLLLLPSFPPFFAPSRFFFFLFFFFEKSDINNPRMPRFPGHYGTAGL